MMSSINGVRSLSGNGGCCRFQCVIGGIQRWWGVQRGKRRGLNENDGDNDPAVGFDDGSE